jgi:hypothetical protein
MTHAPPRTRVLRGAPASAEPSRDAPPRVIRGTSVVPAEESAPRLSRVVRAERAREAARPVRIEHLSGELVGALPDLDAPAPDELRAPSDALEFEAGLDVDFDEPPPPPVDVEALREQIAAEWRERLEEEVARAREDGYRQGHADTQRTHQKKFEADRAALSADLASAVKARAGLLADAERLAATLALDVAESILGAGVGEAVRKASLGSLHNALETLGRDAHVVLTVHPVDLLRLSETGVDDEIAQAHPSLRLVADPDIDEGDWQLTTPETTIRNVRLELMANLRRRLGLLTVAG